MIPEAIRINERWVLLHIWMCEPMKKTLHIVLYKEATEDLGKETLVENKLLFFCFSSGQNLARSNRRFSPGWNHQPGLESPVQWIVQQTFAAGTFSPSLWYKPGLKVAFQSWLEPLTGTKGPAGLLSQVLAPTGIRG